MNEQPLFGVSYKPFNHQSSVKKVKSNSMRYCIVNDEYIYSCNETSCPLYDCSFSKMHKQMTKMFKNEYPKMSTKDSRTISRRLLINTFRKYRKEESDDIFQMPELFR